MSSNRKRLVAIGASAILALGVAACGSDDGDDTSAGGSDLSGSIAVDGSSTVAPLSEAVAESFMGENPGVRISVGTSGTGGGFEKFCAGELDISDASRIIDDEEIALCEEGGVVWEEIRVGTDALTVVVNPENPVSCLTVDQLAQIWGPDSTITNWSEVEGLETSYDAPLAMYGPGTDSGTFGFFTEMINGEEGAQRQDYNNVGEDDNATVTGVSGDTGGIGYFGFSFYQENADSLKALEIDGGGGCVAPSAETAQDDSYSPLSRPLLVYPSAPALERPEVDAFLEFYLANAASIAPQIGFIAMNDDQLAESQAALESILP